MSCELHVPEHIVQSFKHRFQVSPHREVQPQVSWNPIIGCTLKITFHYYKQSYYTVHVAQTVSYKFTINNNIME